MDYAFDGKNNLLGTVKIGDGLSYNGRHIPVNELEPPFLGKVRLAGKKWEYEPYPEALVAERELPVSQYTDMVNACNIQMKIHKCIRPVCGLYTIPKDKDITVLIPSYGKSEYVEKAIRSALNQTMRPYEIIVLDMEEKPITYRDDKVRIVKHSQMNVSSARNYLVTQCKTEYFIFLDADDELLSNYIETVYASKASVVAGASSTDRWPIDVYPFRAGYQNMTMLLNKTVWNEIGGNREDLCYGGEDSFFINEIFRQKKWLVEFTEKTGYKYNDAVENGLHLQESFVRSKEKEIYLHREWYKECLERSGFPYSDKALRLLKDYIAEYNRPDRDTGNLIQISIEEERKPEKCDFANKFWNENRSLFTESRFRETECICRDEKYPYLYGRKFDLCVFARPCFDWSNPDKIDGELKDGCYINNNEIDVNKMDIIDVLKNYNVYFDYDIAIDCEKPDYIDEDHKKAFDYKLKEYYKKNKKQWGYAPIYTFSFFSKCDKKCHYCSQKTFDSNLDEDTLYRNFDRMVSKVEELHGHNAKMQLMGGEFTLSSEEFQKKCIDRLSGFDNILLVTNGHNYGNGPCYESPAVRAYVHITEPPFDDSFLRECDISNVVVNKADLPELIKAVENKTLSAKCDFSCYVGTDENCIMTDDEIKRFDEVLAANGYLKMGGRISGSVEICMMKCYRTLQANVFDMTFVACCGVGEKKIPMEEWTCQPPSGTVCKGCRITNY